MPKFPKSITMKKYLEGAAPLLSEVRAIASEREKSCSQISINWILQKGVIPIPGCRNVGHAMDNFGSLDFSLMPEEMERLDLASMRSQEFSSGGFDLV
jgi:pyridoxine 4-dehydrogenase